MKRLKGEHRDLDETRVGVLLVSSFFFFFQAEDGIRDYKVTGVQTCALPISRRRRWSRLSSATRVRSVSTTSGGALRTKFSLASFCVVLPRSACAFAS